MTTALLNVDDVAQITGLSAYTVRAAIRDGDLQASKMRGRYRIHPDQLAAWIDDSTVHPIRSVGGNERQARTINRPRPRPTPQGGSVRERLRAARKDAA